MYPSPTHPSKEYYKYPSFMFFKWIRESIDKGSVPIIGVWIGGTPRSHYQQYDHIVPVRGYSWDVDKVRESIYIERGKEKAYHGRTAIMISRHTYARQLTPVQSCPKSTGQIFYNNLDSNQT